MKKMQLESLKIDATPVPTLVRRHIEHPRNHRLRLTKNGKNPYRLDRSQTLGGLQLPRETSFEIERPQSHGTQKLVINVATSFMKKDNARFATKQMDPPLARSINLPSIATFRQTKVSPPKLSIINGDSFMKRGFRRPASDKMRPASPQNLSDEKQEWIGRWIENTNRALENDEFFITDPLPILSENSWVCYYILNAIFYFYVHICDFMDAYLKDESVLLIFLKIFFYLKLSLVNYEDCELLKCLINFAIVIKNHQNMYLYAANTRPNFDKESNRCIGRKTTYIFIKPLYFTLLYVFL